MQLKNSPQSWGVLSQLFHWLLALLIFLTLALGYIAHEMGNSPEKAKLFVLHKSMGMTVLLLVIIRVLWRLYAGKTAVAVGISRSNDRLAQLGHLCLYGLMFALPMTGWVVNTAANVPFQWMNVFIVPDLPFIKESWRYAAALIHWYLSILFALMVIGHGGMAVLHHVKHKSNVLVRMLPVIKPLYFAFGFCITFSFLVFAALNNIKGDNIKGDNIKGDNIKENRQVQPSTNISQTATTLLDEVSTAVRTHKQWLINPEKSTISFIGFYDGVPFNGDFRQFSGDIYFDPEKPEQGYFDVNIDTGSVTTYNDDWDTSLPDEDWFFVLRYPQAIYQSDSFTQVQNAYVAHGVLSLKGIVYPVPLRFTWEPMTEQKDMVLLLGSAIVKRTDFNIGMGEWATDNTIGFDVEVKVELRLQRKRP